MGMCLAFTVLLLLSYAMLQSIMFIALPGFLHTAHGCVTLERQPHGVISRNLYSLATVCVSSIYILLTANQNQILIFTLFGWWQLGATSLTSENGVGRGKKGKRHLAAMLSGPPGFFQLLKLLVEICTYMFKFSLCCFTLAKLLKVSSCTFICVSPNTYRSWWIDNMAFKVIRP